jgi:beta-1,4-mannosyltransferase
MRSVVVLVLGDLGRSPRMCNHALSLADEGFDITLTGYGGSNVRDDLSQHKNVTMKTMSPFPSCMAKTLPRLMCYLLKVLWQTVVLLCALPFYSSPDFILLQNPPTIPPLLVCYLYTFFHPRTKLIVDWHNYGFSIMALSLGNSHPLVRLSKMIEDAIGKRIKTAFCVSKAMKKDLETRLNLCATVLYDRPPESFRIINMEERHQVKAS